LIIAAFINRARCGKTSIGGNDGDKSF
jgi:hypothetical protein